MEETEQSQPPGRRSRRRVVVASAAVAALAVGGIIGVQRSAWFDCRFGTDLSTAPVIDYRLAAPGQGLAEAEFTAQISDLPGVGDLLGSAALRVDAEVTEGAAGELLLSASPYVAEEGAWHDSSFDPVSGKTAWSRVHPGQMDTPRLAADAVVTVGAVGGGIYRVTALEASSGRVQGCVDLERQGADGIGRTAAAMSPQADALAVVRPDENRAEVARIDLASPETTWAAGVDGPADHLEWIGSTLVTSYEVGSPAADTAANLWRRDRRVSLRALDAESGQELWAWPADVTDTAPPRMASLLPSVGAAPPAVVFAELTATSGSDSTSRLVGADPRTGEPLWERATATLPDAVAFGPTIVLDDGAMTGAVDATSGELLWQEPTPLDEAEARLDVDRAVPWGEQLLVPTWASGVVVLDPLTGERLGSTDALGARSLRLVSTSEFLALTFERTDGGQGAAGVLPGGGHRLSGARRPQGRQSSRLAEGSSWLRPALSRRFRPRSTSSAYFFAFLSLALVSRAGSCSSSSAAIPACSSRPRSISLSTSAPNSRMALMM